MTLPPPPVHARSTFHYLRSDEPRVDSVSVEEDRALLSCAKRSPRAGFPVPATSFSLPSPCRCSARARIRGVARSSLVEAAAAGGDGVDTSDVAGDAEPRRTAAAKLMPCGVHGNAAWE